jgi:putative transposase
LCLELDKKYKKETNKFIDQSNLQKQTKKCVHLSAKNIHHIVHKYLRSRDAMFRSIKVKHKDSNKVKLPYKQKTYFITGWDYQSVKVDYDKNIIYLAKGNVIIDGKEKIQKPVKCCCKIIPQNIVEVELKYKDKLYLAIKYKEDKEYLQIKSDNVASIDLGEIHAITSIDNNKNSVIITGRKLRSIKRLRNKEQGKLRNKLSKCTKGSRNYKRYMKALNKLKTKTDNQINDCVHKITKHYVDYCLKNNISKVYYGDLDNCSRNTKNRRKTGRVVRQKLSQWCFGQIILQLQNKLNRYNVQLVKISEAYTSQKCPSCKKRNKPKGRNYVCKKCNYKQHRDIVGAINILNDNNNYHIERYYTLKYLQIA